MYTIAKKDEILNGYLKFVKEGFEEHKETYTLDEAMKAGDVDRVRTIIKGIQNNAISSIPTGLPIPKASLYVNPIGENEITIINITLSNKINSSKSFKFSYVATRNNTLQTVYEFISQVYLELLEDIMVEANLEIVNSILADAVKDADVPYTVSVISPLNNGGKKIASITDDSIVFVADSSKILDIEDLLILQEPDELISEEQIEAAKSAIVNELATAQTPEELVGIYGGMLVSYVCNINKRVKPITLIKKVCSKKAASLHAKKEEIGYYNDNGVYSLVARRDGHFEVVLSPFDVETLRKVDFDVISALA